MSLYLKYRPQDFENLVGQTFIKETLTKSIREDKYVWAYLLCWPRWTGKTSTARLLAKTMNCIDTKDWNPCLECNICKDFLEERLVDIIEIDAASNTWVDNIRALIEKAQFRPTTTKYKVYIIDEVHMLSKWAFNALLKILEEPPSFVKFILATTETHKVPETIISRCQRYDFRRISSHDIKARLNFISKEEKIKIDDESLNYIIQNSWGWLRNAISLLEQLSGSWSIIFAEVIEKLWLSSENQYSDFLKELLENDKNIVKSIENINESWKNIKLFFKWLIFYIKDDILGDIKKWKSIASKLRILQILDETYTKTKNSLNEDVTFLVWVLSIINSEEISTLNNSENKNQKNILTKTEKVIKEEVKEVKEKNKLKKKENIKLTSKDAEDIFSMEENIDKKNISNIDKNNFDKKNFVDKVKKAWWSSWLKLSLVWSDIYISENEFTIKFKTPFALKWANTNDNLAYIANALSEMWYIWLQITLT